MTERTISLFFGLKRGPYDSDLCTTLFRMVNEAIAQGHQVSVWTCGGATTLTQRTLGDAKPRNLLDLAIGRYDAKYPSTAALIRGMLTMAEGRLQWFVCRHCMEEYGAIDQIDGVTIVSPFKFVQYRDQADAALILGVK